MTNPVGDFPKACVARMSEAISGSFIVVPRISLRSCGLQAGNANERCASLSHHGV